MGNPFRKDSLEGQWHDAVTKPLGDRRNRPANQNVQRPIPSRQHHRAPRPKQKTSWKAIQNTAWVILAIIFFALASGV